MYYLATPKTIEKFTDCNIFLNPATEILKNKCPKSERDYIGPIQQYQKLSDINSQSFEQSQVQQIEQTKFQRFYQSIRPQLGQMKIRNKQDSDKVAAEPRIRKKQQAQPELFSKNEIVYQLKQLKQQNRIRLEQQQDLIDNLKQEVKRFVTRDQRILSQFSQLQQERVDMSAALANKTGRSLDRTLYQRSNEYRRRLELNQALDGNQLLDKRIWYRQIRKKNSKDFSDDPYLIDDTQPCVSNLSKAISDIYTNFSTHNTPKQRHSEIIQLNTNGIENYPLYSKQTQENLTKRLIQVNPDSPLLKFDYKQELKLEGINKFNQEFESVLQVDDDQMYCVAQTTENKSNTEDIILNTWNLRKKGQTLYPKLTKYII